MKTHNYYTSVNFSVNHPWTDLLSYRHFKPDTTKYKPLIRSEGLNKAYEYIIYKNKIEIFALGTLDGDILIM